jgi:hypothetical protein
MDNADQFVCGTILHGVGASLLVERVQLVV